MERIIYNGETGVFIPIEEYSKGKFFNEKQLLELQEKTLAQRKQIVELEKELIR